MEAARGQRGPPLSATSDDTITQAAAEAGRLLADLPDRWKHTQEVAIHAWWASAGMTTEDRDLLVAAAYLHDIGYSAELAQTGFHPLDGARHLNHTGRPALAQLVAHHSGAAVEARQRGLTRDLAAFPAHPGAVADALTYSDTTTGPRGETVEPGPRYEEIIDRHGSNSLVARSRVDARVDISGAVIRTLRRVSSARPTQQAFTVETVLLGCASLLRPEGSLASSDATGALAAAMISAAKLDGTPQHAIVVDLALVTSLPPDVLPRLQAAITPLIERSLRCVLLDPPRADSRRRRPAEPAAGNPVIEITTSIKQALAPHCSCP